MLVHGHEAAFNLNQQQIKKQKAITCAHLRLHDETFTGF